MVSAHFTFHFHVRLHTYDLDATSEGFMSAHPRQMVLSFGMLEVDPFSSCCSFPVVQVTTVPQTAENTKYLCKLLGVSFDVSFEKTRSLTKQTRRSEKH